MTAPKQPKNENFYLPPRIPTSSSKYAEYGIPSVKVSIKSSGWKSHNPREPVRTAYNPEPAKYKDPVSKPQVKLNSPSPEAFEHIWEEGSKRPKTQNEKCRRKLGGLGNSPNTEVFPSRQQNVNNLYDIPIIVIRDDKNRRVASAKRNSTTKGGKRPSTFKPGKSSLVTSLDQDFLDLFDF